MMTNILQISLEKSPIQFDPLMHPNVWRKLKNLTDKRV